MKPKLQLLWGLSVFVAAIFGVLGGTLEERDIWEKKQPPVSSKSDCADIEEIYLSQLKSDEAQFKRCATTSTEAFKTLTKSEEVLEKCMSRLDECRKGVI